MIDTNPKVALANRGRLVKLAASMPLKGVYSLPPARLKNSTAGIY